MLALDLFNTKYERELQEGAVDDLEARRIDTLNDRMQDLLTRAREPAYLANPGALAALKKQFQQVKDERDSYYKVREAGIPGNVPVEKIPGKEDLLKGRGRSYYEEQSVSEISDQTVQNYKEKAWDEFAQGKDRRGAGIGRALDKQRGAFGHVKTTDQKKNSEPVNEYVSMGSDKNFVEAEPYKNYRIYVRKKPFGTTGMYTAHTEIDRKEFMGKGPSQEEAVQAARDRIDFVLNAQRKVTGSSTIDFNVKFATDLLADPKQTFYAKLENINGRPKLVIASPEVAADPELLAAGDFKRSALRNQPDDSGRATPLPGIPLTAKGLRSGDWIANGRYTVGNETQDRDGNRVFDLTYHSTAHTKSDKLRLNQPAFTLGTAREVDEEKNTGPLDQKLQRLKVQARRQFPRAHTDDEALILKLLDKETQDDRLNRQTDARQDAELRKNFALDREQEDEIEDLQTQVGVKESDWDDADEYGMPGSEFDDDDRLRDGDYVRDSQDGESGEIFRMSGDPEERRVRILDRDGKGWYIEPSRLTRVDPTDPDVQRYFGKQRVRDMDEAISKKDLLSRLEKDLPKVNDHENKNAKPVVWTGAGKDDYGYTGYQGHGMPTDKQERELARKKGMAENSKPGEYYIHTVYFKDGTKKRVRVTSDEFDVADYYTKRGQAVERVDYDFQIHSDMTEADKEPTTRQELLNRVDKIQRMMSQERNPANLQILRKELEMIKQRYQHLQEDNNSEAVERAILNRIMVAHTDLLMKFGPDKVMQAAEEVAYNVGDVDEIGTSDVSAYVAQVKQILGATP